MNENRHQAGSTRFMYQPHSQNASLLVSVSRRDQGQLDGRNGGGNKVEDCLVADENVDRLSRRSSLQKKAYEHCQVGDESRDTDDDQESHNDRVR